MWSTSRVVGTVWQKRWILHMPQLGLAIPSVWSKKKKKLYVSLSPCPLGQNILWEVLSSWSWIALQLGHVPSFSAPMLCSLLSSKVQNTAATFDHSNRFKMPWVAELSYSLFQHAWLNMLPCRSSAGASKCGGSIWGKFCGSQAHYTVCSMHSQMKCSGCWIFYSIKIQASNRWWPSHEQPTLHCHLISSFFALPLQLKILPTPRQNVSPTRKRLLVKSRWQACRFWENFWNGLSKKDAYLDIGQK